MGKLFVTALTFGLISVSALGGDLYKVKVASESDARLLRQTGAAGLVIVTDGYLVLTDSLSGERLQNTSLEFGLLATDILREELAFDASLSRAHNLRLPLPLYEDGNLRICRVTDQIPEDDSGNPLLSPINPRGVDIRFLQSEYRAQELLQRLQPLGVDLDSLISKVSQDSLYAYTAKLQSYGPRNAGSTADDLSGTWLEAKFHALGYDSVVADSFMGYYYDYIPCRNIIAYKVGTRFPNHHIIVGAHRDSFGDAPGADDNASGCAGVLEIARLLRNVPTDLTIVFALFDSEELWMWGSYHYADDATARQDSIVYMLNLDMIGWQENVDSVTVHHSTQTELSLLWIHLADSLVGIKGVMSELSASDHLPFAQKGIEVSFIIEWLFNAYYHSALDSTVYMNFPYMTRLVKASLATTYTVAMTAWPKPTLVLSFPQGQPHWFPPIGSNTLDVTILPVYSGSIAPGTPTLLYAFGDQPYTGVTMSLVGTNLYRAVFPSDTCAATCYFNATAMESSGYWKYSSGSDDPHRATIASDSVTVLEDDFETDKGWTVSGGAYQGTWERVVPSNNGLTGDPTSDYDGSGKCYVTGNQFGNSYVMGGYTYLTSPVFDVSGQDAFVRFAVWFSDYRGRRSLTHTMRIYMSNDSGTTWTLVQSIPPGPTATGGWHEYEFLARDFMPTTSKMQLRFDAYNINSNSIVEAGVDAIRVVRLTCDTLGCCEGVTGNVDAAGIVDLSDLSALVSYLTGGGYILPCDEEANVNTAGIVDLSDLSALVSYLTGGGYVLPNCL